MGITDLSNKLKEQGFHNVLGTVELTMGLAQWLADGNAPELVNKGVSGTWEYNNGTTVVYDLTGHPWIRSSRLVDQDWFDSLKWTYSLKQGAYVPHSNDGGTWRRLMVEEMGVII